MTSLPIGDAARALDIGEATLRRWLRDGAPVARRGRRGRGCKALVDPGAIRAWRQAQQADSGALEAVLRDLAGRMPELLADAMSEAFAACPSKRDPAGLAWLSAAGWALTVGTLLDVIRERVPDLLEPCAVPEGIEVLRKIAAR